MIWTPAAVDEFLRLYAIQPELSFAEITHGLSEAGHNVTRNGVIGKAHRMVLPPRDPVKVLRSKIKRQRNRYRKKTRRAPMPIVRQEPPPPPRTTQRTGLLHDLEWNQCRWPMTEIAHATYLYCTNDTDGHGSWCETHAQKAFDGRRRSA